MRLFGSASLLKPGETTEPALRTHESVVLLKKKHSFMTKSQTKRPKKTSLHMNLNEYIYEQNYTDNLYIFYIFFGVSEICDTVHKSGCCVFGCWKQKILIYCHLVHHLHQSQLESGEEGNI